MFNDNPFRDIKTNPILPITEGADKASKQAKAKAEGHMIRLYGKGRVTHSSHSGGHFVEHESKDGDTHGHTFNPETGKISKTPHVTSSYYGESVTNPVDTNEEVQLDELDIHKIKNFLRAAGVVTGMGVLGGTLAAANGMRHARWDGRQEPTVASNVATGTLGGLVGAGAGGLVAAGLVPSRPPRPDRRKKANKPVKEEVSQLAEGWNDRLEDVTGFTWIDKDHPMYKPKHDPKNTGSHYHNHNTGEGMSEAKVFKLYDRLNSISADDASAGLNPKGKGTPEGSNDRFENTDLFPKNWQINLREHIRNEYSNRGYDATTVEVQETYNHVVSMLNERNQANKEASRVAEIKRGREVLGRDYGFDEDMISAARNSKAGLDPENYFTRRSAHKTKRGEKTKISPSSPAREISDIERKTRQGT